MAQFLKSIRIKNFRSIVSQKITFADEDVSVFVGKNDAGKSNVLRALNLFFNGKTDFNTDFRFEDDYSFMAETGKGKAKEVLVELEISPPKRLKDAETVVWRKRWRADNIALPELRFKKKRVGGSQDVGAMTGTYQWLQKLKFRYVPAHKGTGFFSNLMTELHDVLSEVHGDDFRDSASKFIEGIRTISGDVSAEIEELIGLPSQIQSPSDFSQIFSNLDFGDAVMGLGATRHRLSL